jgi:protein-S-isoprenylcysteine O-methyltransferase Ste14
MSKTKGRQLLAKTMEAGLLLALPILSHFLLPIATIVTKPYIYLGVGLMVVGLVIANWAASAFRRARTSFQLQGESSALTTSGPFRFSRNPMYVSMVIWLVGLAVLLGSLTPFLFPVLLLLGANYLIIPLEERRMEQTFGAQYVEYKQRVRRWL